jgi:hypothetical protein
MLCVVSSNLTRGTEQGEAMSKMKPPLVEGASYSWRKKLVKLAKLDSTIALVVDLVSGEFFTVPAVQLDFAARVDTTKKN